LFHVWPNGLTVKVLKQHYLITLFCFCGANQNYLKHYMGKTYIGIHSMYRYNHVSPAVKKFKKTFFNLAYKYPESTFEEFVFKFMKKINFYSFVDRQVNEILISYWVAGENIFKIRDSYVIWANKSGIELNKISRVVGLSKSHIQLILRSN
jgi:hypothetical protein